MLVSIWVIECNAFVTQDRLSHSSHSLGSVMDIYNSFVELHLPLIIAATRFRMSRGILTDARVRTHGLFLQMNFSFVSCFRLYTCVSLRVAM